MAPAPGGPARRGRRAGPRDRAEGRPLRGRRCRSLEALPRGSAPARRCGAAGRSGRCAARGSGLGCSDAGCRPAPPRPDGAARRRMRTGRGMAEVADLPPPAMIDGGRLRAGGCPGSGCAFAISAARRRRHRRQADGEEVSAVAGAGNRGSVPWRLARPGYRGRRTRTRVEPSRARRVGADGPCRSRPVTGERSRPSCSGRRRGSPSDRCGCSPDASGSGSRSCPRSSPRRSGCRG